MPLAVSLNCCLSPKNPIGIEAWTLTVSLLLCAGERCGQAQQPRDCHCRCALCGERWLVWQQVKRVDACGDVPARNNLWFHWGCSNVEQLRFKFLNSLDAEGVAEQPWRLDDLLGMTWHSCSTALAPVSQLRLFST